MKKIIMVNANIGVDFCFIKNKRNKYDVNNIGLYGIQHQKGITLIALIITIIILLILAGVTINVLIGDNGLFNIAKTAGENYEQAAAREKLEAVLIELQADKIKKTEYNENEYIDNKLKANNMEVEGNLVIVDEWRI